MMLQGKYVGLALLCLTGLTANLAMAQSQSSENPSMAVFRENRYHEDQENAKQWENSSNERWRKSMVSLPKARARLAEEWQHLGISAKDAKVIASAYRPDDANLLQHAPLRGKSGAEVAAMLQSTLAQKNYRLANQLLIDYERVNIQKDPSATGMAGK